MWIDTSDKIDYEQYEMQRIWSLIDRIEFLTNTMAHENDLIKDQLKEYQDRKLKASQFILFLTKTIDNLEKKD